MSTFAELAEVLPANSSSRNILRLHLIPAFGSLDVRDVDTEAVERFKAARLNAGSSPKTVNNMLVVIRAVLDLAVQRRELEQAPVVRSLSTRDRTWPVLTFEQARAVFSAAEPVFRGMVLLALVCGLRLGELRSLRWTDLDFDAARLFVRGQNIPLLTATLAVLSAEERRSEWLFTVDGSQLSHGACKWPLYRAANRAGLEPIGWDILRQTFHSWPVHTRAVQGMFAEGAVLRADPEPL